MGLLNKQREEKWKERKDGTEKDKKKEGRGREEVKREGLPERTKELCTKRSLLTWTNLVFPIAFLLYVVH